jgi:hypothetical protein
MKIGMSRMLLEAFVLFNSMSLNDQNSQQYLQSSKVTLSFRIYTDSQFVLCHARNCRCHENILSWSLYLPVPCSYHRVNVRCISHYAILGYHSNDRAVKHCMKMSYVVGHERARYLLFLCIVSILWEFIIFWCGYVKGKRQKVKLSLCSIKHYVMKTCWGVEV